MGLPAFCVFDFEVYSEAPLSEVGAFEYAAHPSTQILCAAWQLLDAKKQLIGPVQVERNWDGLSSFEALKEILETPGVIGVAHNLAFELSLMQLVLGWDIPLEKLEDSAVLASAYGLPRALEKAVDAIALPVQKLADGKRLIALLCKPNLQPKTEEDYEDLLAYCVQDVKTQVALFQAVPRLCGVDRDFWLQNMRMNARGFELDRDFAAEATNLLEARYVEIDREFEKLTKISSATKTAATLTWLRNHGYAAESLAKVVVGEFKTTDPLVNRVLDLRAQRVKAAVKKYAVMLNRSTHDGRARDTTIFYGAHTGRDAGVGLQPQNLNKAAGDRWEVDYCIDRIKAGKNPPAERVIPVLSECIRGTIRAKKDHKLVVADFAGIELRVLFWMANHQRGLQAIRQGADLYKNMAAVIYSKPVSDVTKTERQLGKQVVLGAGYGIGVGGEKFQAAAKAYGMDISLDLAQRSIRAYRRLHDPIPTMWEELESACVRAVLFPGQPQVAGTVVALQATKDSPLKLTLPSGRPLYYQSPQVIRQPRPVGESLVLTFKGVHGPARKFERRKTWGGTLTENVVQAVARDVLYEALVRLEGVVDVVLAVHDEIVAEVPRAFDMLTMQRSMEQVPAWAQGLPIDVEVWEGERYGK